MHPSPPSVLVAQSAVVERLNISVVRHRTSVSVEPDLQCDPELQNQVFQTALSSPDKRKPVNPGSDESQSGRQRIEPPRTRHALQLSVVIEGEAKAHEGCLKVVPERRSVWVTGDYQTGLYWISMKPGRTAARASARRHHSGVLTIVRTGWPTAPAWRGSN